MATSLPSGRIPWWLKLHAHSGTLGSTFRPPIDGFGMLRPIVIAPCITTRERNHKRKMQRERERSRERERAGIFPPKIVWQNSVVIIHGKIVWLLSSLACLLQHFE
eukprot:c20799_g1_i3 orf=263-580(-)